MHQMEVDLEGEVKEREALAKQLRKSEKALSEATELMTEAQEAEESYKGQVIKKIVLASVVELSLFRLKLLIKGTGLLDPFHLIK